MGLREFKLPDDMHLLLELIPPMFQYPDHPEWSFQADESANMVDQLKNVQRMWPIMQVLAFVLPWLRNALRGYIWEENGKPVGLVNTGQRGASSGWYIGNVGVLPDYRRRGIARKLVEAAITLARNNGAKNVMLEVITANTPARDLYEELGFTRYEESTELDYADPQAPSAIPLPPNYMIQPLARFDWDLRYKLAQRIRPEQVTKFQPVEKSEFYTPRLIRPFIPMLNAGTERSRYAVLYEGRIVATGDYSARLRPGGTNHIRVALDPAHKNLAPYLIRDLTGKVIERSPGRRIGISAVSWQPGICEAAVEAGYQIRQQMISMALAF
jgi:ribosomal protein S18 acetylase RimI-like enzyme